MNTRALHAVTGRLSLRPPQAESLNKLARALDAAPSLLAHERDVTAILSTLKAEFSTLEDFEREFPSLCFALATGVGKTRLMGAFITYLHLAHGINNFFVLAPNLTIYNKLITDFTRNTPKYVFKGIAEFAQQPPLIINGDNYDQTGAAVDDQPRGFAHDVRINIFNISKINSEVRGGKEPRIKRMREVLGDSYFNHLASLPDLVLLMDESHRYRASAGVRSINELKPLFGLELTATPFTESTKGPVPFKNVVMDYPLARAMEDGFVKEPAVVTQRDFDAQAHSPAELERVKLQDGIRLHELTKAELLTYAHENDAAVVKPFMLVIARDTTHAAQLLQLMESDSFFEGRYRGKVIQVDSSRTGAEEEKMIQALLNVESRDEPTEIVIHVNMLKEGWDVTNLYTIVPLRAANARTLIEQSIGRGLRLPYGKRTGVEAVDRLNIVAHDKFQEIIDEANRGDSPIRLKSVILDAPGPDDRKTSLQVESSLGSRIGLPSGTDRAFGIDLTAPAPEYLPVPIFETDAELKAAKTVLEVIGDYEVRRRLVPTSSALLMPDIQKQIVAEVEQRIPSATRDLLDDDAPAGGGVDLQALVAKTTQVYVESTVDIPRITVVPKGEVTTGFHPFRLDTSGMNFQPGDRELIGHTLRTNTTFAVSAGELARQRRLEDYVVHALLDYEDIDYYAHSGLLYDLAGQALGHLRGYLTEEDAELVLAQHGRTIARAVHAQMMSHFWEKATVYDVQVARGFTALRPCSYTATAGQPVHNYRETVSETSKIKQMLFGGFTRCLYPIQKFNADTERRFAVILERDALKWFTPAKGQFQIYYKLGTQQLEYIPDFVAETEDCIYLVETKANSAMQDEAVRAKTDAAVEWCKHASEYAKAVGSKPWLYLLIPHDEVLESKRLTDFRKFRRSHLS